MRFFILCVIHVIAQIIFFPVALLCRFCEPLKPEPLAPPYHLYPKQEFSFGNLLTSGDGPKFLGMAYAATQREDIWEAILKLVYNGTLNRVVEGTQGKFPVFSGDQMSGLALAMATRIRLRRLTPGDAATLKPIFDKIFFSGWPMALPGASFGRGWMWCPWEPCGGSTCSATTLAWIAYAAFGEERYARRASHLQILSMLSRWSLDFNFAIGKIYMQTWYAAHTLGVYGYAALMLGLPYAQIVLGTLALRYPSNPDLNPTPLNLWKASGLSVTTPSYSTYFSIRSFKLKALSNKEIPWNLRIGNLYPWEASPHSVEIGANFNPLTQIFPSFALRLRQKGVAAVVENNDSKVKVA